MSTLTNSSFKEWQVLPPLSLTLPPLRDWERENQPLIYPKTHSGVDRMNAEKRENVRKLSLLPQREGEGEDEPYQIVPPSLPRDDHD